MGRWSSAICRQSALITGREADRSVVSAAPLAKKVRNEFETAVRLDPNDAEARSDLAEFYIQAPAFMGGGKNKAEREAEALARQDAAARELVTGHIQRRTSEGRPSDRR